MSLDQETKNFRLGSNSVKEVLNRFRSLNRRLAELIMGVDIGAGTTASG